MTKEQKWAVVWGGWVGFFAVAEYAALKSEAPEAPLSHHLRRSLGIGGKPLHRTAGQAAMGTGVVWLVVHLYERVLDNSKEA